MNSGHLYTCSYTNSLLRPARYENIELPLLVFETVVNKQRFVSTVAKVLQMCRFRDMANISHMNPLTQISLRNTELGVQKPLRHLCLKHWQGWRKFSMSCRSRR